MAGNSRPAGRRRVELFRAIRAAPAGAERAGERLPGRQIQWPTDVRARAVSSLQGHLRGDERVTRRPAQPLRMSGQKGDLSRTDGQRSLKAPLSAWRYADCGDCNHAET